MRCRPASFRPLPVAAPCHLEAMNISGLSLIELLVAVVIIEVAALGALGAAFQVARLNAHATRAAAIDAARWATWQGASMAPSCRDAAQPIATPLMLPAAPPRTALPAVLSCGR